MARGDLPGRERWANRTNLLSGCRHLGLASDEADSIIGEIKSVVTGSWANQVRGQGGTAQDCKNLVHAIAYDGFEINA